MWNQLFHWDELSQLDTCDFNFTDIVLKVQIGPYPAGTKFAAANISYDAGTLILFDKHGPIFSCKLAINLIIDDY